MKARVLIVDGTPSAGQELLVDNGGARVGQNYVAALQSQMPGGPEAIECFVLAAADGERLPQGMALGDFHGIAWTGSPLGAYEATPAVTSQIDLARATFESGVPCFGSCWGLQVMAVALGGKVHINPNGYEVGIARRITVNEAGRSHPMLAGKPVSYDALCIHQDEVAELPAGAVTLASNAISDVQVAVVEDGSRSFWGVQYHPEYDLAQMSALLRRRSGRLIQERLVCSEDEAFSMAADLVAIGKDTTRKDIAWKYGIGPDILDGDRHRREFANWLRVKVCPGAATRP